eukprot:3758764-Rhodomonas_salina.1
MPRTTERVAGTAPIAAERGEGTGPIARVGAWGMDGSNIQSLMRTVCSMDRPGTATQDPKQPSGPRRQHPPERPTAPSPVPKQPSGPRHRRLPAWIAALNQSPTALSPAPMQQSGPRRRRLPALVATLNPPPPVAVFSQFAIDHVFASPDELLAYRPEMAADPVMRNIVADAFSAPAKMQAAMIL